MPLFEMTPKAFEAVASSSFSELGVAERGDLQRLLRHQIGILGEDLLVVAEEFGDWQESKRRVDLLAIDRMANLVVVELKRTQDGGHMELQAIRYASMVAAMTFERAAALYAAFIKEAMDTAKTKMLEFLGWHEPDEDAFANAVRILLVSANFSKELTTAVLWLREHDIDIRCIRLQPYTVASRTLVDVQPIIPLPEAEEYTVRLREKEQQERRNRTGRWSAESQQFCVDYWNGVLDLLRPSGILEANGQAMRKQDMRFKVNWPGFYLKAYFSRRDPKMSVWLRPRGDAAKTKYQALKDDQTEIDRAFGRPLLWQDDYDSITYRLDGFDAQIRSDWPRQHAAIAEAVVGLYRATKPFVEPLLEQETEEGEES